MGRAQKESREVARCPPPAALPDKPPHLRGRCAFLTARSGSQQIPGYQTHDGVPPGAGLVGGSERCSSPPRGGSPGVRPRTRGSCPTIRRSETGPHTETSVGSMCQVDTTGEREDRRTRGRWRRTGRAGGAVRGRLRGWAFKADALRVGTTIDGVAGRARRGVCRSASPHERRNRLRRVNSKRKTKTGPNTASVVPTAVVNTPDTSLSSIIRRPRSR